MKHVTVNFFQEDDIEASILIEGLPGVGHVGKLVADHLIDALGGELIAEIYSLHFPPQVIVDEEGVAHLVGNELYRCEKDGKAILFLVGDFQSTSAEGHYILTESYLDIAEDLGVQRIYALGGYGVVIWSRIRGSFLLSIWSISDLRWRRPVDRLRTPGWAV